MKNFEFGIITPSYAPDFERCRLLAWSVAQFISPSVKHYIIVPSRDLPLFRQIQTASTEIITVESVLPWWIKRLPLLKSGWLSFKNVFIRGWILQQVIKLAAAEYLNEDVFVFVDSDVTFIRPFHLQNFIRDSQVRLFRVSSQVAPQTPIGLEWHQTANRLLAVSGNTPPVPGYVGQIVTWRRDNLIKMYEHIQNVSGRGWIEAVSSSQNLSEYILYGVFVDQVLQNSSGHYEDSQRICAEYWSNESMSDEQLQKFFLEIEPQDIAVMISAKAGIPVDRYQNLIENIHI